MSKRNLENVKEILLRHGRIGMRVWCDLCGWMSLEDVTDDDKIICVLDKKDADPMTARLTFNNEGCLKLKVGGLQISDLESSDCVIHPNPSRTAWNVLTWRKGTVVKGSYDDADTYFIVDKVNVNDDYDTFIPLLEVHADFNRDVLSIAKCQNTSDGEKCKLPVNNYCKLNDKDTRELYRGIEKYTGRLFFDYKHFDLFDEYKKGQYVELTYARPDSGLVTYGAIFDRYDTEHRAVCLYAMVKTSGHSEGLEGSFTNMNFDKGVYFCVSVFIDRLDKSGVPLSIQPADLATTAAIDDALHASGREWNASMGDFDTYEKPASCAASEKDNGDPGESDAFKEQHGSSEASGSQEAPETSGEKSDFPEIDSDLTLKIMKSLLDELDTHKFQPFEKVLVRDCEDCFWAPEFFRQKNDDPDVTYKYKCFLDSYKYCIPYNPATASLLDTSCSVEELKKKLQRKLAACKDELESQGE